MRDFKFSKTLRDFGLGLLGVAVPLVFLPSAEDAYVLTQQLALALALSCLFASSLLEPKKALKLGSFDLLALGFFAWRLLSWVLHNFEAGLTGRADSLFLQAGLFFWASQHLDDANTKLKVKRFVITGAIFACVYGILQAFGWDPFSAGRQAMGFGTRAHASLGNPDFFGGYLILIFPLVLAKTLTSGSRLALPILFFAALLLTQTRAAWLGCAAGTALFTWRAWPEIQGKTLKILGAVAAGLILFFSIPSPLNPTGGSFAKRAASVADLSNADAHGRIFMSAVAAKIALEHPILGVGSGEAYTQAYLETQGKMLNDPGHALEPYRYTQDVHDDWLQLAGESGFLALVLMQVLWAGLILRLLAKKEIEPLVIACILLSFGVNAVLHFPLAIVPSGALVWLFLGWACASTREQSRFAVPARPFWSLGLMATFFLSWFGWCWLQSSVLLNHGMSMSLAGQPGAAKGPLEAAAKLNSGDGRIWMRLGLNEDQAGDEAAAKAHFAMALMTQPALPEALGNLGLAEAKLGSLDKGKEDCLRSLEINPRSVEILGNLGKIEYLRGDLGAAEAAYAKGLALDPDWEQGHFNLAAIYINTKRGKLARPELQAVLRVHPSNAQAAQLLKGLR